MPSGAGRVRASPFLADGGISGAYVTPVQGHADPGEDSRSGPFRYKS